MLGEITSGHGQRHIFIYIMEIDSSSLLEYQLMITGYLLLYVLQYSARGLIFVCINVHSRKGPGKNFGNIYSSKIKTHMVCTHACR